MKGDGLPPHPSLVKRIKARALTVVCLPFASLFFWVATKNANATPWIAAGSMILVVTAVMFVVTRPYSFEELLAMKHVQAEDDRKGGVLMSGANREPITFTREDLLESLALRVALRQRFSLRLDLGDESPEFVAALGAPLATWRAEHGSSLPVVETLRSLQSAARAHELRQRANIVTSVVDEAVLHEERLYVREGKDVASMELALLREEHETSDGSAVFVFGKSTRVVFASAKNDPVVAALRAKLTLIA